MKSKLHIPALILSASLVSGSTLSGSKDPEKSGPIEHTKENISQVLSGKDTMQRLRQDIEKNTTLYSVRRNDTIASIADHIGIDTEELLNLNAFLDKPLVRR